MDTSVYKLSRFYSGDLFSNNLLKRNIKINPSNTNKVVFFTRIFLLCFYLHIKTPMINPKSECHIYSKCLVFILW